MTKGERIKHIRERLGKTQTEFADDIGVSKQTLYKYENDIITNVPSDKIELMAELTGVDPGYVMGWQTEYHRSDIKPLKAMAGKDLAILRAYHSAMDGIKDAVDKLLDLKGDD